MPQLLPFTGKMPDKTPGNTRKHILACFAAYCLLSPAAMADSLRVAYDAGEREIWAAPLVIDPPRFTGKLSAETRFGYIFPSHRFLAGENKTGLPIQNAFSAHIKYAFGFPERSHSGQIFPGAYQGIGMAYYSFGEPEQLGNPVALYLFQGARIAAFSPRLTLNYEWNFGLSGGWKPYNEQTNELNHVIGSKLNAYLNVDCFAQWRLSPRTGLTSGFGLTHFSNGNTKFPNAGLNLFEWSLGVTYRLNPAPPAGRPYKTPQRIVSSDFPRHISYDVLLFGSWRCKGVYFGDDKGVASPYDYTVLGFNITPMYNFGYRLRVGLSLDGVYDGSANVYTEDYIVGTEQPFFTPPIDHQIALGLSARGEYTMPYFTVGVGMGANVLHKGGDLKGLYQLLTLKIEITRNSFLHIGYTIKDFHDPNYLMFGIGYRFNNRYLFGHR